jgi:hypothetical protein
VELKPEIFDHKIRKLIIMSFDELMALEDDKISPDKLWNWIEMICQEYPHDSSDGLYLHAADIQRISDPAKLHLLKEHHYSPILEYQGPAKTFKKLFRNPYLVKMRNAIDRYMHNCHICQSSKPNNQKTH